MKRIGRVIILRVQDNLLPLPIVYRVTDNWMSGWTGFLNRDEPDISHPILLWTGGFAVFCVYCVLIAFFSVNCVICVFLQYFDTVGWVLWPVKTVARIKFVCCLLYNLYCVGGDVKPCSINQSINQSICYAVPCHMDLVLGNLLNLDVSKLTWYFCLK